MEADDTLLTQIMMELGMWHMTARSMRAIEGGLAPSAPLAMLTDELPLQDPLSTELNKLREKGTAVSTWLVFAASVLLDAHDVLGQ